MIMYIISPLNVGYAETNKEVQQWESELDK